MQDLISGAMQFENFLWLRGWKTTTFKLRICTGRNPQSRLLCWMFQINELFLCCLSVQCLLLNFVSADYRKWLPWNSIYFQYLSAKLILFWVWPQPITRHETDIQKWLRPWLLTIATGAKKWNEKDTSSKNMTAACRKELTWNQDSDLALTTFNYKVMLHETIQNDDFYNKCNTALQCWNNVGTIRNNVAITLQRFAELKLVTNRLV